MTSKFIRYAILTLLLFCSAAAAAQQLNTSDCIVTRKIDSAGRVQSEEDLARWQPSVRVIEGQTIILQRCSFSTAAGRVTCDSYSVDRIETDAIVGIRKLYYFRGQYDVQIFPDGRFVENNGRGSVAFGQCSRS